MRSGLLWFLPTSCPHLKTFVTDFGPKCALPGFAQPSVCLGFVSPGEVDQLTFEQMVNDAYLLGCGPVSGALRGSARCRLDGHRREHRTHTAHEPRRERRAGSFVRLRLKLTDAMTCLSSASMIR